MWLGFNANQIPQNMKCHSGEKKLSLIVLETHFACRNTLKLELSVKNVKKCKGYNLN